jgi:hypothetical protein
MASTSASSPSADASLVATPVCCENIDEIVQDHDNFGTDENEDSLDSLALESLDAALESLDADASAMAAERNVNETTPHRPRAVVYSSLTCDVEAADRVPLHLQMLQLPLPPIKRKSTTALDDATADLDECDHVSVKKQCVEECGPMDDNAFADSRSGAESLSTLVQSASEATWSCSTASGILVRKPASDAPSAEVVGWVDAFSRWSHSDRIQALDHLIAACQPAQVRHMMAVIEPQFQRDFISLLPKEVCRLRPITSK